MFSKEDGMKTIGLHALYLALFLGVGALIAVPTDVVAQAKKETAPAKTETAPAKTDAKKKEKRPAMTPEQKKAKSKECSDLANQRGLKGKERRKFRAQCKRGAAS
jgi:hypothetical protein